MILSCIVYEDETHQKELFHGTILGYCPCTANVYYDDGTIAADVQTEFYAIVSNRDRVEAHPIRDIAIKSVTVVT